MVLRKLATPLTSSCSLKGVNFITFHVSQLKKHIGPHVIPTKHLPLVDENGLIKMEPEAVIERKLIPRPQGNISIPVVRWLIKWVNMPVEAAT